MNKNRKIGHCLCGGESFSTCCQPLITGQEEAPDALALMRSRYTAYVLQDKEYLKYTWHTDTLPDDIDQIFTQPSPQWLGLNIKDYQIIDTTHAEVEFIARYKLVGKAYHLHERSQFLYLSNRWVYVEGKIDSN